MSQDTILSIITDTLLHPGGSRGATVYAMSNKKRKREIKFIR